MPDAYEVYEGRFVQVRTSTSAANALTVAIGPVPTNRVWTIIQAFGSNSVGAGGETQYYWFSVDPGTGLFFPVTQPVSIQVDNVVGQYACFVREGMELKLYPQEYLACNRDAATAGSSMTIYARFIESALPIYEEYEPQVRRGQIKRSSTMRGITGTSSGMGGGAPSGTVPGAPPVGGGTTIPT